MPDAGASTAGAEQPNEVVHIASHAVRVGDEIRQRCVWCGHELLAVDLRTIAVQAEHADQPYPTWPAGDLIGVSGPATYVVAHKDGDPLPPTFCAAPDDLSSLPAAQQPDGTGPSTPSEPADLSVETRGVTER